eukprot:7763198-Pyramimonas_sp.AAC.1
MCIRDRSRTGVLPEDAVRRGCASSFSWGLLSTPSECVAVGNRALQMIRQTRMRLLQGGTD